MRRPETGGSGKVFHRALFVKQNVNDACYTRFLYIYRLNIRVIEKKKKNLFFFHVDSIRTSGPSGTDTQTRAPRVSIRRKSLPVRLVKHTLGKERALRIAVLLVLEVRFVLAASLYIHTYII